MTQPSLNSGQILQSTFQQVGPVYLPILLLSLPGVLISLVVPGPLLNSVVSFAYGILVGPILGGACIILADRAISGQTLNLGESLSIAFQKAGYLILATLLLLVIMMPAFFLLVIPGIYLSVKLFATQYAVIFEDKSPIDALASSWELTKGQWWPIFGTIFLIGLVLIIPIILVSLIFAQSSFGPLLTNLISLLITPVLVLALLFVYKSLQGSQLST
ncbi:MAG: hypothetical protein AAF921_29305 [Cyanobacteria bacterium P01_D01_bin.44]